MWYYIGGMRKLKNVRITDESHKWLVMQRALTDVPANQQIQNLIDKEIENAKETDLQRDATASEVAKETT